MGQRGNKMFTQAEWAKLADALALSPRQAEIVQLLCDGHKNYSVAQALGISPETVRTHVRRLYGKLGVTDRTELLCLLVHTARNACPPD